MSDDLEEFFENKSQDMFYGGYGDNDDEFTTGGNEYKKKGGAKKIIQDDVRTGYDSFTIFESSTGESGGRYISKTPSGAAAKVASNLISKSGNSTVSFIIRKTTQGSNGRYYSYDATSTKLDLPVLVFKKLPESNMRIVQNNVGQILKVKKTGTTTNSKGREVATYTVQNVKGSKKPVYSPSSPVSNLEDFDYTPYILKKVEYKVHVKSTPVPEDLKQEQKNKVQAKKKKVTPEKKAELKAKKEAKKAELKAKKEAKKAELKAKKEAKKAELKAKKAEKAELKAKKAELKARKKVKDAEKKAFAEEKKALDKEKKAEKKAAEKAKAKKVKAKKVKAEKEKAEKVKAEKKPKAKKPKAKKPKAKKPKGAKAKKVTMFGGSSCAINSCF